MVAPTALLQVGNRHEGLGKGKGPHTLRLLQAQIYLHGGPQVILTPSISALAHPHVAWDSSRGNKDTLEDGGLSNWLTIDDSNNDVRSYCKPPCKRWRAASVRVYF